MDHNFTKKIQEWLQTPKEERDYSQGALFLLQLSNNQIMYRNLMANPKAKADFIEYQIQKYLNFRVQSLTHDEVEELQLKVDKIATEHRLDAEPVKTDKDSPKSGKRQDHDELPDNIKALYIENAGIIQQMRELHMKLRSLSLENATCPDSERYPFLKELIALDKKYHSNWQLYDSYDITKPAEEQTVKEDEHVVIKNVIRQISLTKGRYKKNPTDDLKKRLQDLYSQLPSPTDKLTAELKELGVIE